MNIAESFATYMASTLSLGSLGTDIKIGGVDNSAPDTCWWVVMSGGTLDFKTKTGEAMKNYVLDVYYRAMSQKQVYDQLDVLEKAVNISDCPTLQDFDTIDITATVFPTDSDIDNQDRTVGLIQITVKTYYKE